MSVAVSKYVHRFSWKQKSRSKFTEMGLIHICYTLCYTYLE